jgi:hypothetical protein
MPALLTTRADRETAKTLGDSPIVESRDQYRGTTENTAAAAPISTRTKYTAARG